MADYKRRSGLKEAQEIVGLIDLHIKSDKKRKEMAIKNNKHKTLFEGGQSWLIKGNKLEDARESFKFENRRMTDEEFKEFKLGFVCEAKYLAYEFGKKEMNISDFPLECTNNKEFMDSYCNGRGFTCGYNGVSVPNLPKEFVGKKAFLEGYRAGIQAKAEEKTENNKRR